MPYFGRGSLQTRIEKGPLSLREAMRVAQGVLAGLARVHAAGLLHLDAKPTNVLFDDRDTPLLADFGQSRRVSATGVVNVPSLYSRVMPPETLHTGIATVRSDIYQAGLLLYRVVNGEPHYRDQVAQITPGTLDQKIARGKFPDRSLFQPHVPQRLRTAIRKALKVDPSERFDSATDFADDLARIPIPLDWAMSSASSGISEWRAPRQGRGDLVVRRLASATRTFDIEIFTDGAAGLRAKGRADLWKRGMGQVETAMHLTTVFAELSA